MLDDNVSVNLSNRLVLTPGFGIAKRRAGFRVLVSNAPVEVARPLLEFGLEMRSGRPVLPLVLVPLSVNTDFGGLKAVISNPKQFVAFGMHHARQTAGLECQKFDRGIGVEEFNLLICKAYEEEFTVVVSTCDQGGKNEGLRNKLEITPKKPFCMIKVKNDKEIKVFVLHDWVHIFKV